MVIEIVDRTERIDAFLATAGELLRWALVTREPVLMTRYGRSEH
jgi:PII-like signaling protein